MEVKSHRRGSGGQPLGNIRVQLHRFHRSVEPEWPLGEGEGHSRAVGWLARLTWVAERRDVLVRVVGVRVAPRVRGVQVDATRFHDQVRWHHRCHGTDDARFGA